MVGVCTHDEPLTGQPMDAFGSDRGRPVCCVCFAAELLAAESRKLRGKVRGSRAKPARGLPDARKAAAVRTYKIQ